jgi:hypothetical protein
MLRLEGIPISLGFASGIAVVYDYEVGRRIDRFAFVGNTNFCHLGEE